MLDLDTTVARAVLDHSETALVFQRHRIDYCCQGNRSIATACHDRGLDAAALLLELEGAIRDRVGERGPDVTAMTTPVLIDYIVSTHHAYLYRALPFLCALASKVARVHGDRDPRLVDLSQIVHELTAELDAHLDAEESVLFPALSVSAPDAVTCQQELAEMLEDHVRVGDMLAQIRARTDDFAPPTWACTSYRTLFSELGQLEEDIFRHVHFENHLLAPRFVSLSAKEHA